MPKGAIVIRGDAVKKFIYYFVLWPITVLLLIWLISLVIWAGYMNTIAPLEPLGNLYTFLTMYSFLGFAVFGVLTINAWYASWDIK